MSKEKLVWARHTRRWEFAHKENEWWVRRDFSTICKVGEELAILPVPAAPKVVANARA